tara:strand:- start:2207 stop:2812 length:606 start_codon:yes stop_codon:yes gene_type:complete
MKTHPINITSNNDNNNIYENYVIDLNIELSKENKQLRQNIFEANNIISENQKEIHEYDKKVRYMKTLINNLSEFKSVYYNVYHNLNTHLNEDIRQYDNVKNDEYNFIVKIFVCQIFVFILFIILNSVNDKLSLTLFKYILLLFWLFNLTINYFKFYRYYHNFNIKQFNIMKNINSIIKTMLLNINKLESSTISLDTWICEI